MPQILQLHSRPPRMRQLSGQAGRLDPTRRTAAKKVIRVTKCTSEDKQRTRAVVVGAGPVGIASAAMLANRGWQVDVLEKRPAPSQHPGVRTYPMQINKRACLALQEAAGLDLGAYLAPRANEWGGHLVDWFGLNSQLLSTCRERYPESVRFHWECGLNGIDLEAKSVKFAGEGGAQELTYDLLVGADGASSTVRSMLLDIGCLDTKVLYSANTPATRRFKVVHGLDKRAYAKCAHLATTATEDKPVKMLRDKMGFGGFTFWPRVDGSVSAMVMALEGDFEPERFAFKLHKEAAALPQSWRDSIIEQTGGVPASMFGSNVRNSSFAGPGAVLVGDAAHAVTSTLGQGCCLGLSGMKALAAAVDTVEVADVPQTYNTLWVPQAHALQKFELLMALSIGKTLEGHFYKLTHLCSLVGATLLQHVVPKYITKPFFFSWFGEPTLSYRRVYANYWGTAAMGSGIIVGVAWLIRALVRKLVLKV